MLKLNGIPSVPEDLRAKAELYEERNKLYGDNYKLFGPAVMLMFPNGVTIETPDDMSRFGVLVQVLAKVTRYCNMFNRGGHDDSLDDIAVYAMMLKELDQEARADPVEMPELLSEEDLKEAAGDWNQDHRSIPRQVDPGSILVGDAPEWKKEPTHYVYFNGTAHFVKEARFFAGQNGLTEPWGKKWRPVVADSIPHARKLSHAMDWKHARKLSHAMDWKHEPEGEDLP